MKNVHIFNYTPHHFRALVTFFKNIDKNAEFYVFKHNSIYSLNSTSLQVENLPHKLDLSHGDIRFILVHGLWDVRLWLYIFQTKIYRNIVWVAWGADIYLQSKTISNKLKNLIFKFFKFICIKHFRAIIALNAGDAKVIWKLTKHNEIKVIPYPLDPNVESLAENSQRRSSGKDASIKILLGNSGAVTNNHIGILKKLARFNNQKIEIICPLSYGGDEGYVHEVVALGNKIFGEKFKPLLKVMDQNDYFSLLQDIDILIFDHSRQQGLFNIYYFLLSRKKIYINEHSSTYTEFKSKGIELGRTSELSASSLGELTKYDEVQLLTNYNIFRASYSEAILSDSWKDFLNELD
ncbi:hypothetical protein BM528_15860 [Alteromonas sp. RW2A1]|uniref:TDP-N-acetylfucosamine:lipid II N-acetylfucosaminyltransferase n=1 Tax=Alteromonas sp. RW2A1 TaxID=1917158 RepID=UPI000903B98F|nr:TDP-N-acetylfucosamine:lipid II N-acetylfucosaminyltransferase [Alteromonas sp. RW2A1]APE07068.1 hypothetical protein BM528_15860 [Alteromonas sp. RW2A1]